MLEKTLSELKIISKQPENLDAEENFCFLWEYILEILINSEVLMRL